MIELMVTLVIVAILAGIGIKVGSHLFQKQAVAQAETQLALLEGALEQYQTSYGAFPEHQASNGLGGTSKLHDALFSDPVILKQLDPENDRQDWLLEQGGQILIVDPWGNEYHYRSGVSDSGGSVSANPGFDLWSCGPDGETSTGPEGAYEPADSANLDDVRRW